MEALTRRMVIGGAAAFWTPVASAQTLQTEYTFFTLGDWGRHGRYQQCDVARAMHCWAKVLRPQFIMTVGDNFYQKGLNWPFENHWRTSWEEVYHDDLREIPWVPALGNHDYWGSLDAQLRYRAAHPSWHGQGSTYYSYHPWTGPEAAAGPRLLDIFVLDTSVLEYPYFGPTFGRGKRDQKAWLEAQLSASRAEWKLVFGHHAVFSGGYHGRSRVIGDWLQGLLERHGVQAYVCGHDHDLQHFIAGQEKAPHYILTGGGSKVGCRGMTKLPGGMFQEEVAGFTAFQIVGDNMFVDFVGADGSCLHRACVPKVVADAPPPTEPRQVRAPAYWPIPHPRAAKETPPLPRGCRPGEKQGGRACLSDASSTVAAAAPGR